MVFSVILTCKHNRRNVIIQDRRKKLNNIDNFNINALGIFVSILYQIPVSPVPSSAASADCMWIRLFAVCHSVAKISHFCLEGTQQNNTKPPPVAPYIHRHDKSMSHATIRIAFTLLLETRKYGIKSRYPCKSKLNEGTFSNKEGNPFNQQRNTAL